MTAVRGAPPSGLVADPGPAPRAARGRPQGPAVSVRDVSVTARRASGPLDHVDLEVAPGELVALLGADASGARTLVGVLAGRRRPTSGGVALDGRVRTAVDLRATVVVDLGAGGASWPRDRATLRRSLASTARRARRRPSGAGPEGGRAAVVPGASSRFGPVEDEVVAALAAVGLADRADVPVRRLDVGARRRLQLAGALLDPSAVLLVVEPFAGLDAPALGRWRDDLRRVQREAGLTTVLVTHDQASAFAVADRVAVLDEGRVAQVGTPEELCTTPACRVVAEFVGVGNRLRADVVDGRVRVPGAEVAAVGTCADGPVVAWVRPEDVVLAEHGAPGTVAEVTWLGRGVRTRVLLADGVDLVLEHPVRDSRPVGERVHVRVVAPSVVVVPADAP